MTDKELKNLLEQDMPEVPDVFHRAMLDTLAQITAEEGQQTPEIQPEVMVEAEQTKEISSDIPDNIIPMPKKERHIGKRRMAAAILIAALLLASVAVAAVINPDVFSVLLGVYGRVPEEAHSLIQHNLAERTVDGFRLRVDEAAYDGSSLYILYSIRDMNSTTIMGEEHPDGKSLWLTQEAMEEAAQWPVGWWCDHLWINGQDVDMTQGSGGEYRPGSEPGELLYYELFRIDNAEVILDGTARITLPIGRRDSYTNLIRLEDGTYAEPTEEILTFELNTDDLTGVSRTAPNEKTTFNDGTVAWVSRADFTPLRLYLTLNYDVPEAVLDAYKQAMGGEGYYDENGELVWPYTMIDVTDWVYSMTLVDENGKAVSEEKGGYYIEAHGPEYAEYLFPFVEEYPSPLYLAPVEEGVADMTRKVLVRP